jgi:hypothetical protein
MVLLGTELSDVEDNVVARLGAVEWDSGGDFGNGTRRIYDAGKNGCFGLSGRCPKSDDVVSCPS